MNLIRPTFLLALAALLSGALAAHAASAGERSTRLESSARPAGVSVVQCRSNPYYAGRELGFRTRMKRVGTERGQRLEVSVGVWRRLDEQHSFRRLKIGGLERKTSAKDPAATVYEREIMIKNVETAARYRLKAVFRWRDPKSRKVTMTRTVKSKTCRQRGGLPKLAISRVNSLQVAGSNSVNHVVTVVNHGSSEALAVPVAIDPDNSDPVFAQIPSIGPGQSADVAIVAPDCQASAVAQIDPLKALKRLHGSLRSPVAISDCR